MCKEFTDYLNIWLDVTVSDWFKRQCRNPFAHMYLYYKPNNGGIYIGEEPLNDEWVLANPQRISPAWSKDNAKSFVRDILAKLPIF